MRIYLTNDFRGHIMHLSFLRYHKKLTKRIKKIIIILIFENDLMSKVFKDKVNRLCHLTDSCMFL